MADHTPRSKFVRAMLRAVVGALVASLICAALAAALAPYVYAELMHWLSSQETVDPAPPHLAKGRMVDDYFAVEDLGGGTYAIGEPRYWQQNYAYLIVGNDRAVLFDAGSGTRDMSKVVASLTSLPVTVMVSHLHFDHLGGVRPFGQVAMIDLPETRADVEGGKFRPSRYEFEGFIEGKGTPAFAVSEWVKPGATLDLGGRSLTVLSTPGHTSNSIALVDDDNHRLFIGDFIYPTTLYAFLPGASLSAYHRTTQQLLKALPADTVLWTAHCCRKNDGIEAPWLRMKDLADLDGVLGHVMDGSATPKGFFPRVYEVNEQMTLATAFPWNNR
jgi:glyoxylase-like metal-dependent hydrolase (beta-lactamase superfamily II)